MWELINEVLVKIDDIVWGVPLMVLILAGGLLLGFAGCGQQVEEEQKPVLVQARLVKQLSVVHTSLL